MVVITLACAIFWQTAFKSDHALYLSVVEIVQTDTKDQASVRVKVFINDIEDAVFNETHERIRLSDTASFTSQKMLLKAYFKNHFELTLNNKVAPLTLIRGELNGDAIWLQFNAKCESKWKTIAVKADYLMELFPTQSNVLSIVYDNKKHFARFTRSKSSTEIKF